MKVALAQINTTVGDVQGNLARHKKAAAEAARLGAELVVFPELSLAGYPAWDLLEHRAFLKTCDEALRRLAFEVKSPALLVGLPAANPAKVGKPIFNGAALLHKGKVQAVRAKSLLPTYDVFDERRHFEPAESNTVVEWNGRRLGITICEDAWNQEGFWPRRLYDRDPVADLSQVGVDLLINLSASPYHRGKRKLREEMLKSHARRAKAPLLFCNLVGGNDELIFDGNSLALGPTGSVLARAKAFEEDLVVVDLDAKKTKPAPEPEEGAAEIRRALTLGLRDYTRKTRFSKVVIGLSGGIDSAVACALAVDALGPTNVIGVSMPSEYSSKGSIEDAEALAKNLGIELLKVPIAAPFDGFRAALTPALGPLKDLTEQNLQPRVRGTILMAISNQTGAMLVSTGNKSEISTGYCTLYGDLAGGLAVLADLPKGTVYELAREFNRAGKVIPEASITKPPSAELKPNQKDQDDLPEYDTLDRIIEAYIERGLDVPEIVGNGTPRELVESVLERVDRNEYKRRQAPPGLKITPKAFGIGRKMPLARGSFRK